MSRPENVACTRDFSHLFVRLERDETCPHCYILELEADNAALKRENERLRDEILRENTKFGQVERDDLIG